MQFLCPTCQRRIAVADHLAGSACQCPHCGQRMHAPSLPDASRESAYQATSQTAYGSSAKEFDDDRWEDDARDSFRDDYRGMRSRRELARAEGGGMAIAGLVCGIIGVVLFCAPILAWIMGVLGIIFGSIGMNTKNSGHRGMAIAGVCCGIAGIALGTIIFILTLANPTMWIFD